MKGDSQEKMIRPVRLVIQFQESPFDVWIALAVLVPIYRVCYLASRVDIVRVKAVLLQAGVCKFLQLESALDLLAMFLFVLERDSDCVVAHQTEVFEERSNVGRSGIVELNSLYR